MSTELTRETKGSMLKISVNRAHLVNEGKLDRINVDRAMYMKQVEQYLPSPQCRPSLRLLEGDQ